MAVISPFDPLLPFRQERADEHDGRRNTPEATLADGLSAWKQQRQLRAESDALVAVLELHRPELSRSQLACGECQDYDGRDGVRPAPWPCSTYLAVRDN